MKTLGAILLQLTRFAIALLFAWSLAIAEERDVFDVIEEESNMQEVSQASFVAIHKVSSASRIINVKLNEPVFFYNLEICLHKCFKDNSWPSSGDYAMVTLTEHPLSDDPKVVFSGWLLSDSISLSVMEHPVYEVFLKACK